MADDISELYLEDDLDDIPVVVGGERRLMREGRIISAEEQIAIKPVATTSTIVTNPSAKLATVVQPNDVSSKPAEPPAAKAKSAVSSLANQLVADQQEIEQQEKKLAQSAQRVGGEEMNQLASMMSGLLAEVKAVSGVKFESEDLCRRFQTITETYFRDLRDELETKSKLTTALISGGLGLTEEQAVRLMSVLKSKRGQYEVALKDRTCKEKSEFVALAAERHLRGRVQAEEKEREELDRRFAKLIGTELSGTPSISQTKAVVSPPKIIKVEGKAAIAKDALSSVLDSEKRETILSRKNNELAGALKSFLGQKNGKTTGDGKKSLSKPPDNLPVLGEPIPAPPVGEPAVLIEKPTTALLPKAPPLPSSVQLSQIPVATKQIFKPLIPINQSLPRRALSSLPTISETGKPLVSDVKITPKRLMGPVEELRSITLKDFRRLSKDPKEATLKLKDKVDLLGEEQSFEVKTSGIKAWRESPVNKLYLEILRRSLEGKPITDVIAELEAKGEDALTKPEFDAIMKFNREIRFA
jgi:hypothetical protein